ncbi:two-component system response regulator [Pontibacter silvestris]|uniref:Two-component system response regulator n=1 Tax=Pontibacter silvestris TaxID=2305183 RepID=A0ABW4WXN5_9BACT|nr:response regulator [Pontibacter silvestris]MCC9137430.1 response regulator [Pontibacter silvestris]
MNTANIGADTALKHDKKTDIGIIENTYIIDDDAISSFLTENVLEGFSKNLKSFSSAKVALEEIFAFEKAGTSPFAIFLDLNMPVMDGWTFLNAVAHQHESFKKRCKIVILSSSIDKAELCRANKNQLVLCFISKPLDEAGVATVKALLSGEKHDSANYS